ncbi:flavin-containing monooxygenase [Marinobacter zhejiangensis]|uniref:Predicted flavoprotein CzcO associated with the cation diffusion facilitator CzcD n=1 Tax=Marinobacter zhejiangensis TaxID=488535 RepID=A0A1I4RZE2_9GAMM|nr:NAD(P)/FAD-dependent oxidoreductase [Marinobacter zhejiangensis]SFM57638.1 Predicted flavoprotein CzcO associated with the cation diffusion facilitator CzcD [Marinobacter zhejiangensis]
MAKKIAVVGAGFAGLSTGKLLYELGYEVTIFEKDSEVGGVWTSSRRYPGLGTQNPGSTYALSEHPMPKSYPEWPTGSQMQKYFESYVNKFGFRELISLNTEVVSADYVTESKSWSLKTKSSPGGHTRESVFDFLVVCNGIFSKPKIPEFEGSSAWKDRGGKLIHTSELNDLSDVKGKRVVVVGYGKSSCDAANSIAEVAESTDVVARKIIWKVPKKIGGVLNFKHLFLTRFGEGLFPYIELKGFDKIIHGPAKPIRNFLLNSVGWIISKQLKLKECGLYPYGPIETIARTSISLATDGFFKKVKGGKIKVHRDTKIDRFSDEYIYLENGTRLKADVVVAGTGFHQEISFFDDDMMKKLTKENGDFNLYKQVIPVGVPGLAFVGYNSSFFSQLSCETAAMFVSEYLRGGVDLPNEAQQQEYVDERLRWADKRTDGNYFKGTYVVPFSLRQMDEILEISNLSLSRWTKFKQWLFVVNPSQYASCYTALKKRNKPRGVASNLEERYARP